jgi:RHS repeat-associated protein
LTPYGTVAAIELIDVDKDGDQDFVVLFQGGTDPKGIAWFENRDRRGRNWTEHGIQGTTEIEAFKCEDLDHDGWVEIYGVMSEPDSQKCVKCFRIQEGDYLEYEYDARGQLEGISRNGETEMNAPYLYNESGDMVQDSKLQEPYSYFSYRWDKYGNLERAMRMPANIIRANEYCYDEISGLLSECKMFDENVVIPGNKPESWLRFEWDGMRLLRIDEKYDGDDSDIFIGENDPFRPLQTFIYGPSGLIRSDRYANGEYADSTYYYSDQNGNVIATKTGDNYEFYEMDPFGNRTGGATWDSWNTGSAGPHLMGKWYDPLTGLYYFGARWYDPTTGRFISPSPYDRNVEQPYVFAENNPLNYVDPDGELVFLIIPAALVIWEAVGTAMDVYEVANTGYKLLISNDPCD